MSEHLDTAHVDASMLERVEITRHRRALAFKHMLTVDWRFE